MLSCISSPFDVYLLCCVWLFATPWTTTCQALQPMRFSRQESGVGCHFLLQYLSIICWKCKSFSHVWLFAMPWTIQSIEFSRPEYWSGQPFPSPGDLPTPGIEPRYSSLQDDSLPAEPQGKPFYSFMLCLLSL